MNPDPATPDPATEHPAAQDPAQHAGHPAADPVGLTLAAPIPAAPEHERPIVGIDLGGTNMQVGVVRFEAGAYRLLGRSKRKTKGDLGEAEVIERIAVAVERACAEAMITPADLAAVGLGAPGAVQPFTGVIHEAVNLRWNDLAIADRLRARLGVPIYLDNDVNVAIVGEHRLGAGRGARHLLGVWCGTGVGGGIIFDNRLHYGHFLTGGEIGHMHVLPNNPPGSRSLEHNCSRSAITDRIVKLIQANRKSILPSLTGGDLSRVKSSALGEAFRQGDELVREVVDDAAKLMGIHLAGLQTLLGFERIVLGGGLTEALGEPWVARVAEFVRKDTFPDEAKGVEVVATQLADDAGLVGAAVLACERLGDPSYHAGG